MIKKFFDDLFKAYGALYLAKGGLSSLLLFAATMVNPVQGLIGMAGGTTALLFRRFLQISEPPYNIDVMNAVFVSLALAKTFEPSLHVMALVLLASCITILIGRFIQNTLRDLAGLPVLSLPFVLVSWLILPASLQLGLTHHSAVAPMLYVNEAEKILQAFGALYFNPDCVAGSMVLLGFFLLSPILCCLGVLGYIVSESILFVITNNATPSLHLIAGYNGIVTAMIIGGILGIPHKRHMMITVFSVTMSTFFSITESAILGIFWLPVFSSPFIAASYLTLLVFRGTKAPDWARYWLPKVALPEKTLDRLDQHEVRGLSNHSTGLFIPFRGTWDIYQSFDGAHTHQGLWRHALDFFIVVDGFSFASDGTKLTDYYCYGKDVCSPVHGHVVTCRQDVEDNPPGQVNVVDNWGNYVIILICDGSYVVLAHLQKNSLTIDRGNVVTPGMTLGKCGNSGRSLQPHLHMQMQKTPHLGAPTIPFHLTHALLETSQGLEFSLNLVPREQQRISQAIAGSNLKEAMHIHIGNTLSFTVTENHQSYIWNITSNINQLGQLSLNTDNHARILAYATDILSAFDDRSGPADPVFDTLLLSIGLTPYSEQAIIWHDSQPISLMPLPFWHRALVRLARPFGGGMESEYQRSWSHEKKLWLQIGRHSIRTLGISIAEVVTEAEICEGTGLVAFNLFYREKPCITARLSSIHQQGDAGIPSASTQIVFQNQAQKNRHHTTSS